MEDMKGRIYYHLYLRGNFQQDIFYDRDDFIQAINRLALSAHATNTKVLAFEYLDNHYHLVVKTDDTSSFMHHYRMSTTHYHRKKYGIGGMLGCRTYGAGIITDPNEDGGEDLRDAIAYVLRNVMRHNVTEDFYNYKWSSIRLYFNPPKPYKTIDEKRMKKFLPRPHKLPKGYSMDESGIILLQDFIQIEEVEELFGSKPLFHQYLSIPSKREKQSLAKDEIREQKKVKAKKKSDTKHLVKLLDNEIAQFIISELDNRANNSRLAPKNIKQMNRIEKIEMASIVFQKFPSCGLRQLSRILCIPPSTLRDALAHLAHQSVRGEKSYI